MMLTIYCEDCQQTSAAVSIDYALCCPLCYSVRVEVKDESKD